MTNEELYKKIGKRNLIEDSYSVEDPYKLTGEVNYLSGIDEFDKYLLGKKSKKTTGVIHLAFFPKGLLIKLQTNFSSLSYGVNYNELKKTNITKDGEKFNLIIETEAQNIIFSFEPYNFAAVEQFLENLATIISKISVDNNEMGKITQNIIEESESFYLTQESIQNFNENQYSTSDRNIINNEESDEISPDKVPQQKVTPKHFINSLNKQRRNTGYWAFGVVLLLTFAAIHTMNIVMKENHTTDSETGNIIVCILLFLSLLVLLGIWNEYHKISTFINPKNSPIFWNWDSGSFLIINVYGIVFYEANPREQVITSLGVEREWDNEDITEELKGIVESIADGKISESIFQHLPRRISKEISNVNTPLILLSKKNLLTISLFDINPVKLLIVTVKAKDQISSIRVPVPTSITFSKIELDKLENYFKEFDRCKAKFSYIDKTELNNLINTEYYDSSFKTSLIHFMNERDSQLTFTKKVVAPQWLGNQSSS